MIGTVGGWIAACALLSLGAAYCVEEVDSIADYPGDDDGAGAEAAPERAPGADRDGVKHASDKPYEEFKVSFESTRRWVGKGIGA